MAATPRIHGIYETVLYGDVPALEAFYREVLGLRLVEGPDELAAAFRLPDGAMLLLFDPERSSRPGRPVPSHGASGPGHIAFRVPEGMLDAGPRPCSSTVSRSNALSNGAAGAGRSTSAIQPATRSS